MNVARNIRKIRELRGFSQQYVANVLGVSQRHLSRLENDEVPIKVSILNRICTILDVSIENLLSFDEEMLFQQKQHNQYNNCFMYKSLKEEYEKQIALLEAEVILLRKQLDKKN